MAFIKINIVDGEDLDIYGEKMVNHFCFYDVNTKEPFLEDEFKIINFRVDKAREVPLEEADELTRLLQFIGARTKEERDKVAKGNVILEKMGKWIDNYVKSDDYKKKMEEYQKETKNY